jgi:nucleoside-diphosphate-sugar epimerase
MRVFLTGATGFLGSRVLPLLERHEVLCLSRRPDRLPHASGVTALRGDLTTTAEWRDEVERFAPQWCIHLAWDGLPDYSFSRCRANLDAGLALVDLLVSVGVKRVVVAGSCWEYGRAAGAVAEDLPPVDCGVFAATKHALRMLLDSVAREARFEYRWARIFFTYGPGQRATSLIPHLRSAYVAGLRPELREPGVFQDFIYVDDAARGLVALAECDTPSGIFNIGTGEPTVAGDVANRVAQLLGQPAPHQWTTSGVGFWADTARTFAATGWRATTGIDAGIAETLAALAAAQ